MEILQENPDFLVLIKPVGVESETGVAQILEKPLYPVHRLDMNVGGVMVYAKTPQAAAELSRLIAQGQMVKEYVAAVHGQVPPSGDWTDLLFKDSRRNKVFVVDKKRTGVKEARLEFTRLTDADPARVRIRLHTGRSHQIRVQFASRGFPLVGDRKYGARDKESAPMLFSCCITFPWKGEILRFEAMPPW